MHLERLENRGLVTVQNVWRLHRIGNFHTINSCVLQGQSSRAHIRIPLPLKHHDLHLGPNGPLSPNPYTRHRWLINNHKIPLRFRTTYNPSIQRNKQSRSPQCNYMNPLSLCVVGQGRCKSRIICNAESCNPCPEPT